MVVIPNIIKSNENDNLANCEFSNNFHWLLFDGELLIIIGLDNGLVPTGINPLFKPMVTHSLKYPSYTELISGLLCLGINFMFLRLLELRPVLFMTFSIEVEHEYFTKSCVVLVSFLVSWKPAMIHEHAKFFYIRNEIHLEFMMRHQNHTS